MNGQKLEEVTLSIDGTCTAWIQIRIGTGTAGVAKLDRVWKSKPVGFQPKHKLFKSLIVYILLYRCETGTLLVDHEKRILAF